MKYFPTLFVFCLFLFACNAEIRELVENAPLISVKYVDGRKKQLHLRKQPQRIVSLAPSITESIFALGGQGLLIARSPACNFPEAALDIEEIGVEPSLDFEQLTELEADMLLTNSTVFSPSAIEQIEQTGMPVFIQNFRSFEDLYFGLRQIGKVLDKAKRADHVVDSLSGLEKRIVAETANQVPYGSMILVGAEPLVAVGGKGILHELIQRSGAKNIFGDKEVELYETTVAEILALKPEYIILPSANDKIYNDLLARYPSLINTPADVNKQVFVVDPELYFRPGPRLLEALLNLTQIHHNSLTRQRFL